VVTGVQHLLQLVEPRHRSREIALELLLLRRASRRIRARLADAEGSVEGDEPGIIGRLQHQMSRRSAHLRRRTKLPFWIIDRAYIASFDPNLRRRTGGRRPERP